MQHAVTPGTAETLRATHHRAHGSRGANVPGSEHDLVNGVVADNDAFINVRGALLLLSGRASWADGHVAD
jgi:hypothetical protein